MFLELALNLDLWVLIYSDFITYLDHILFVHILF